MNSVWNDCEKLAESKGWKLLQLVGREVTDWNVQAVSICQKRAPWKADESELSEYGEYGVEFFTHRFYWRDDECMFESGNYMMRSFSEAQEDAAGRL